MRLIKNCARDEWMILYCSQGEWRGMELDRAELGEVVRMVKTELKKRHRSQGWYAKLVSGDDG